MKHRLIKYLLVAFSTICLLCGSVVSYAESPALSLQIKFITESGPVVDSAFKLYHVMTTDGENLIGEFAELNIEKGDLGDSENIGNLAYTLASYVASGVGKPVATASTDALGCAGFGELTSGIYLVTGSSAYVGDNMYTPKPALIRIIGGSEETVVADVKYTITSNVDTNRTYTVKKVWEDGNDAARPTSVTVQLLQNGETYDEETLSAENNWSYTWEKLSTSYEWNVVEKDIPANYAVSITLNDSTFTIKNTGAVSSKTNPKSDEKTKENQNLTQVSDEKEPADKDGNSSENDTSTVSGSQAKLPQTGQLWWPVPVLLFAGALLFFIGFITDRLSENDEEK